MATSQNAHVQGYMNDIDALDDNDPNIEAKLDAIARAVAEAQGKLKPSAPGQANAPVDPADAFACDGCQ
jgi:hypothetical protein